MPSENEYFSAPAAVHLYRGIDSLEAETGNIASFLRAYVPGSTVTVREEFLRYWMHRDEKHLSETLPRRLAQIKILNPWRQELNNNPLPGELAFEKKFLAAGSNKPAGILYDGFGWAALCSALIPPEEVAFEHCHIILTNQLLGTWDENNRRYHVRVAVFAFPSLISTSGIVEGPARPREYYLGRKLGADEQELEGIFKDTFIGQKDARMQEVIKGYVLQALFYHILGEPFCDDRECRLFNAHWQAEMIRAQLRPQSDLCCRHRELLRRAVDR